MIPVAASTSRMLAQDGAGGEDGGDAMTRQGEDDPPEAPSPGVPARDGYGAGVSPFRPPTRRPLLHRLVPVSEQLPGYRGGALRRDLLAGVTVAALALPAAMAYGELAGCPRSPGCTRCCCPPSPTPCSAPPAS